MNHDLIESLFRTHYGRMYRLALSLLHDEAEAKDAASDIFARLLDGRAMLPAGLSDGDDPKIGTWLMVSARNHCLDIISHRAVRERFRRFLTTETRPSLVPAETTEARYERLNHLVDTVLTPQTRTVFRLRTDDRLSCRDIATYLHISEAAVYKHLAQATRKLQEHFNPHVYGK